MKERAEADVKNRLDSEVSLDNVHIEIPEELPRADSFPQATIKKFGLSVTVECKL